MPLRNLTSLTSLTARGSSTLHLGTVRAFFNVTWFGTLSLLKAHEPRQVGAQLWLGYLGILASLLPISKCQGDLAARLQETSADDADIGRDEGRRNSRSEPVAPIDKQVARLRGSDLLMLCHVGRLDFNPVDPGTSNKQTYVVAGRTPEDSQGKEINCLVLASQTQTDVVRCPSYDNSSTDIPRWASLQPALKEDLLSFLFRVGQRFSRTVPVRAMFNKLLGSKTEGRNSCHVCCYNHPDRPAAGRETSREDPATYTTSTYR